MNSPQPNPQPIFGRTRAPDSQFLAKAAPEAALEPNLPIIDAHLHFWHRGNTLGPHAHRRRRAGG